MPLPVLSLSEAFGVEDLLRQARQAELRWCEQLADETLLDGGRVFMSRALSTVAEANGVLDPVVRSAAEVPAVIEAVDRTFMEAGGQCLRWAVPSEAEAAGVLVAALTAGGFGPVFTTVLHLRRLEVIQVPAVEVAVIPARAALGRYRSFVESLRVESDAVARSQHGEAALLHLDDGRYDVLTALAGGRVVGAIGISSIGQVGVLRDLVVAPSHRGIGIEPLLLTRSMESCARSLFRHVLACCPAADAGVEQLFLSGGFVRVGQLQWMQRAAKE